FTKRGIMNGPDGKPIHAELTLRGTTLMLGPESPAMGRRTAKSVGASPASLYIYVENVDKVVDKATKLGASSQGPVMDMFWGDRCGTIADPDGYTWMVGTHKAEPTAKEMKKGMLEMMKTMKQQPERTTGADLCVFIRRAQAVPRPLPHLESCSGRYLQGGSAVVDQDPLVPGASR